MQFSILSEKSKSDQHVRLGGKIRPGIMRLVNQAQKNQKAVEIYHQGVENYLSFDDIGKKIVEITGIKNPLYPSNVPYFSLRRGDFGMPEIVEMIISKYGEVREGDSRKLLYRFPVVFHTDVLEEIYPNGLKSFVGNIQYQSHYQSDGKRYCRFLPEVTPEMVAKQKASRHKQVPQRAFITRGECVPENCQEYLCGECRFRGTLKFYIPGIVTTGLVGIDTGSTLAALDIWNNLDEIKKMLGTIPRFNPNRPGSFLFYVTKRQEIRTYFDENGKKKSGKQWVVCLQADLDMGKLLIDGPSVKQHPVELPNNWSTKTEVISENAVRSDFSVNIEEQDILAAELNLLLDKFSSFSIDIKDVFQYLKMSIGSDWDTTSASSSIKTLNALLLVDENVACNLIRIGLLRHELTIEPEVMHKYLKQAYGAGYSRNLAVTDRIVGDLTEMLAAGVDVAKEYILSPV